MGDGAPRRRSEGTERSGGRCGSRRRVILYVAGGLLGPGWWLCGAVYDGPAFGRTKADVHFAEFVLASGVVVVASWGLLLILGEAMLFALAVVKAGDRERYDVYRNLMILWGYVLTLGIPRHFRRLPAQFGPALEDDDREDRPADDPGHRRQTARPSDTPHRHKATRPPQEAEPNTRAERRPAGGRPGDKRGAAASREGGGSSSVSGRAVGGKRGPGAASREGGGSPQVSGQAAGGKRVPGAVSRQGGGSDRGTSMGPIFPAPAATVAPAVSVVSAVSVAPAASVASTASAAPAASVAPAAPASAAPVSAAPVSAAPVSAAPVSAAASDAAKPSVPAPQAGAPPDAELRTALDLLLRYAVRVAGDPPTVRAEAGGDV
jgi:hypothetical protein